MYTNKNWLVSRDIEITRPFCAQVITSKSYRIDGTHVLAWWFWSLMSSHAFLLSVLPITVFLYCRRFSSHRCPLYIYCMLLFLLYCSSAFFSFFFLPVHLRIFLSATSSCFSDFWVMACFMAHLLTHFTLTFCSPLV